MKCVPPLALSLIYIRIISIRNNIYGILLIRPPIQVANRIVIWIIITMKALCPRGGKTNKCL